MPPPQAEIPPTRVEFPQIISSAPAGSIGAGRYIDGRSRRRTGRIEQINVKVSSQFNGELRGLADRENILIVEALERALNAYLRLVGAAEASGQHVVQVLDNLRIAEASSTLATAACRAAGGLENWIPAGLDSCGGRLDRCAVRESTITRPGH
jgi:hypothetical protein